MLMRTDEEFLELMCDDEDLLRAEFDAIIAREWPSRPPPADPPAGSPTPGPRERGRPAAPVLRASRGRPRTPGAGGRSRQRSPPRRTAVPRPETERQDGRRQVVAPHPSPT